MTVDWKIRRWAAVTVLLYAAALVALTAPLLLAAFGFGPHAIVGQKAPGPPPGILADEPFREFREVAGVLLVLYRYWPYWILIGLLTLSEALVLLVPIAVARGRPVRRARWTTLAVAAGFLMGLLILGLVSAIAEVVTHEPWADMADVPFSLWALGAGGVGWIAWGIVFWRYARAGDEATAVRKVVDRLLAGSTAELLVAVPCHVYARDKDYCCAGGGTFTGLAAGTAVMVFAFGPGVFFLFAERLRRLRGREEAPLRGVSSQHYAVGPRHGAASAEALSQSPRGPEGPAEPDAASAIGADSAVAAAAPRLGPHTRDMLLWSAAAAGAATGAFGAAIAAGTWEAEPVIAGRAAFLVAAGAAFVHAVAACRRREPHRLWAAAGAAFLLEIAALGTWWWVARG